MKPTIQNRLAWPGMLVLAAMAVLGMTRTAMAMAVDSAESPTLHTVATLNENVRPAGIPADYVVTPNGFFAAACVHHLQAGEKVLGDGSIKAADGTRRAVSACTQPRFTRNGTRIDPNGAVTVPKSLAVSQRRGSGSQPVNGWVIDSNYLSSVAIGNITSYWTVPAAPSNPNSNEYFFFFNGLEQNYNDPNVSQETILQPVLDWNNFGTGWHMSNWNCCLNGTEYYNGPFDVSSGDTIEGIVASTCGQDPCGDNSATVTSIDLTNGQNLAYQTDAYDALSWVFGGVMEAYNISSCSQFANSSSLDFYDTTVRDVNGNLIASPPFAAEVDTSSTTLQCGYNYAVTPSSTTLYWTP